MVSAFVVVGANGGILLAIRRAKIALRPTWFYCDGACVLGHVFEGGFY